MNSDFKIKKSINYGKLNIQLLEPQSPYSLPYDSISNINAIDSDGNVVWKAEAPKSHYSQYYDISVDTNLNSLIAIAGSGYRYLLNMENGKIIDYYLVK